MVGLATSVAADDPGCAKESAATVSSNESTTSSKASNPSSKGSTSGNRSSNASGDGVDDRRGELAVDGGSASLRAAPGDVAKVAAGVALLSSTNAEAVVGAKGGAVDGEVTDSSVKRRNGQRTAPRWRGKRAELTRIRSTAWTRQCGAQGKRCSRARATCSCS